jgi:nitrite reductase/ring-hydroxylating ferredoxin subunit
LTFSSTVLDLCLRLDACTRRIELCRILKPQDTIRIRVRATKDAAQADKLMSSTDEQGRVWHHVGDTLSESGRIQANIQGRPITVLRHKGKLFCIDSMCYHGGGPLGLGDIEDIDGKACLNCSWHHYKITIDGGEKLYQSTEFDKETKKLVPAGWKSVGQKQRVHLVEERDGGISVHLLLDGNIESDKYSDCSLSGNLMAPDSTKSAINKALKGGGMPAGGASGVAGSRGGAPGSSMHGYAGKPSGHVFQGK